MAGRSPTAFGRPWRDYPQLLNLVYEFRCNGPIARLAILGRQSMMMRLTLSAITSRKKTRLLEDALEEFTSRLGHYASVDQNNFTNEAALDASLQKPSRVAAKLVLLDPRGRLLSSEQLAAWIGKERDTGTQHLHFAIGPADGWSQEARERADLLLSFGPMTFPHELARVMLAEQLYRAFTILAGHPYHGGH